MSGAFVKLFASIVTSSVWSESDSVRIVWVSMLAIADRTGVVGASIPGLARVANVSREKCEEALTVLASPDPDDCSGVKEGRRIEAVAGGWRIVNYLTYRERGRNEDRREYFREAKREARSRVSTTSTHVHTVPPIGEAEAEADADRKRKPPAIPGALDTAAFREAWELWRAYRAERRLPTWRAITIRIQLARLAEMGESRAIAAIRHSAGNGFSGIYEPKSGVGLSAQGSPIPCAGSDDAEKATLRNLGRRKKS